MKNIIKQATDYSNLSQWIQMEIWKYIESLRPVRTDSGSGGGGISITSEELVDRIIKRVLADKNLVNNKIHKEGFDAGYKKGFKEGRHYERYMDIRIKNK